eukprot:CAMPEP_0113898414 /NCGR_PEP_ID=MMETSP0780_2-20120614/19361_1 /TAXON_ID=652834 /ORGANISM="Palpitomonas bilix" /LENGTH=537 /DNA_ID=CAMNT_0000890265 /DNA_START=213 /DNA_END=1823 /DNA_ORIENTATION=+ /assembly_acc=CAM_ASM_000599
MGVTDEEVRDYAIYLGVDLPYEEYLLPIAKEALLAPLPPQWVEHVSASGDVYFYNKEKDESLRKHPLEDYYRDLIKAAQAKRAFQEKEAESKGGAGSGGAAVVKDANIERADLHEEVRRKSSGVLGFENTPIHEASRVVDAGVTIEEMEEMETYLGVDLFKEPDLLIWVYRAVVAPVPEPWEEHYDAEGKPYYYFPPADRSTRKHPYDAYISQKIAACRSEGKAGTPGQSAWLALQQEDGRIGYYDFSSRKTSDQAPPEGTIGTYTFVAIRGDRFVWPVIRVTPLSTAEGRTRDHQIGAGGVAEIGQLEDKRVGPEPPSVDTGGAGGRSSSADVYGARARAQSRIDDGGNLRLPVALAKIKVPEVEFLTFFSWWSEEGKKRYLELEYDLAAKKFTLVADKLSIVENVPALNRRDEMLCGFDLHVGAKLNVLGKLTTLMQASIQTTEWQQAHYATIKLLAEVVERELKKYRPARSKMLPNDGYVADSVHPRRLGGEVGAAKAFAGVQLSRSVKEAAMNTLLLCDELDRYRPGMSNLYR